MYLLIAIVVTLLAAVGITFAPMGYFICVVVGLTVGLAGGAIGVYQLADKPRIAAAERMARAVEADARLAESHAEASRRYASLEHDKLNRELSVAREDYRRARDAYRRSETRFYVARVVGQLREFARGLREERGHETLHEDMARLLKTFKAARSQVESQDSRLEMILARSRRDLEWILYPERASSVTVAATTASSGDDIAAMLRRNATQIASELDDWIKDQPREPIN